MTISEIAAQMGVTPETLVQEVVEQGTANATAFVVLGALAIVLAVAVLVVGAIHDYEVCILPFVFFAFLGVWLLTNAVDLVNWKTAPQATANQYIVEHYGGGQE